MSKWVIGKYIRLSLADQDLMKKENKSESESISHQKALIQNFINGNAELNECLLLFLIPNNQVMPSPYLTTSFCFSSSSDTFKHLLQAVKDFFW